MALTSAFPRSKMAAILISALAIGLIVISLIRGHPIEKQDLTDLYGCYTVEGQTVFRLTPDAFVPLTTASIHSVTFTARQGRFHAYLDPASAIEVVHRGASVTVEPRPVPIVPIEVHRGSPRALLMQSDTGVPIEAIRSVCPN